MKKNVFTLFILLCSFISFGQHQCKLNNLWVNGTFEDTVVKNHCNTLNPINTYWNTAPPFYGYVSFIFKAGSTFQPSFVNEATIDHTLGTSAGHYFYVDPRASSGKTYQIRQSIKVTAGTSYNFSAWFCSMIQSAYVSAPAVVELYVNGVAISAPLTLNSTVLNNWQKLSATWVATSTGYATLEIMDNAPVVGGHDFAIDDIEFGVGKFDIDAGKDISICKDSIYTLGGLPTADNGATCDSEYSYSWTPSLGIITATNIANPKIKISTIGKYDYVVTVKDLNGNLCSDTVSIKIVDEGCQNPNNIRNFDIDNKILLYPNPTMNFVRFANLPLANTFFNLYNNLGQKVMTEGNINSNSKINLSQLPAGLYYYDLADEFGLVKSRNKIIKL